MSKKEIEGKTIDGEDRTYRFNLVTAETGLRLSHKYAPKIIAFFPRLDEFTIKDLMPVFMAIEWEELMDISSHLLHGAEVEIDGLVHTANEQGMFEFAGTDPVEFYTAIFYAVFANYPKYVGPFLEALTDEDEGDKEDDTTQDSHPAGKTGSKTKGKKSSTR